MRCLQELSSKEKERLNNIFNNDILFWRYRCERRREFESFYNNLNMKRKRILVTDCYNYAIHENMRFLLDNETYFIDASSLLARAAYVRHVKEESICFFCVSDVRSLPYKDITFDVIISESTIDHIPPGDLSKTFNEFYRVLKKEGYLLLTLNNKYDFLFITSVFIQKHIKKMSIWADYFYDISEVQRMLEEVGFNVIKKKYLFPWFSLKHWLRHFPADYLTKVPCEGLFKYISPQFIIVAKR